MTLDDLCISIPVNVYVPGNTPSSLPTGAYYRTGWIRYEHRYRYSIGSSLFVGNILQFNVRLRLSL